MKLNEMKKQKNIDRYRSQRWDKKRFVCFEWQTWRNIATKTATITLKTWRIIMLFLEFGNNIIDKRIQTFKSVLNSFKREEKQNARITWGKLNPLETFSGERHCVETWKNSFFFFGTIFHVQPNDNCEFSAKKELQEHIYQHIHTCPCPWRHENMQRVS